MHHVQPNRGYVHRQLMAVFRTNFDELSFSLACYETGCEPKLTSIHTVLCPGDSSWLHSYLNPADLDYHLPNSRSGVIPAVVAG